jgi:hypothetical protein
MSAVFVSYRRSDAQGWAGRLGTDLGQTFGDVARFFDLASIPPGADFVVEIERAIAQAAAALVLIGPRWLDARDPAGARRLDDPDDVVRLEIASALARSIPVIPVLLGGATMPRSTELPEPLRPLARRNAVELTDSRWDYDRDRLFSALEAQTALRRVPDAPAAAAVSVGAGLHINGGEVGDVAGVRGALPAGTGVEVLRDAKLTKVKMGDITGVDMAPGKKKQ